MIRFNDWLATKITAGVSTMWCAYIFAILALVGFPGRHATAQLYVQWLSQTFIQLTMLSILAVSQKLLSDQAKRHQDELRRLHKANHDVLLARRGIKRAEP